MAEPTAKEMLHFGEIGFLYKYDVRYDPADRAFCNPLADGRVQFRLHTEPGFAEVNLVLNDGTVQAITMTRVAETTRFDYWEVMVRPTQSHLFYSFALQRGDRMGKPFYLGGRGLTHAVEVRFELDLDQVRPLVTPDWVKGAVIYQIFPERFANGDPAVTPEGAMPWGSDPKWLEFQGGDLRGITQQLDYLEALGVDVLYLNPIFLSPSNHKFDAIDFYQVDPAFGGNEAFRELIDALHARDMKLFLDASFNHCYPLFFAFKDLIEKGEASAYKDWFFVEEFPVRIKYRPHLITDEQRNDPNFQRRQAWFKGFTEMSGVPVVEVSDDDGPQIEPTYHAWYGVLDMPKLNQENPETRQYFLDLATYWIRDFKMDGWRMDVAQFVVDGFWQDFRAAVKDANPDSYLLSEIWGDTSHWLQGDMFDGTMNYLFRDLALSYFARAEMSTAELHEGLTRLYYHYAPQVTAVQQNLLSSHDVARFLRFCDEDKARFRLATLFQMTLPGAPSVYYGDEIGMTGGHDPDNRRAFLWHKRDEWDDGLLAFMQTLIAVRRGSSALRVGDWRWVWQTAEAFAFERRAEEDRVLVVLNRGEALDAVDLEVEAGTAEVLFGSGAVEIVNGSVQVSAVGSWDGVIVRLGV